jgi:hypothetical protein
MMQYETRLGDVIQEKIKSEALITNLLKLKGKRIALDQERERLKVLIQRTQDDYLNRGKIDSRVYDNMIKTYVTRLSQIEEEIVYMEAKERMKSVGKGFFRIFKKKGG